MSLILSVHIHRSFNYFFPPFNELIWDVSKEFSDKTSSNRPLGSEGGFRDLAGVLMGMRRMTADIAWISVLQYYGSHNMAAQGIDSESKGEYPALKTLVLRTVRLDPYFDFAYLYGAGSLAFNLGRFDEAIEILEEGVKYNPTQWKFRLYIAAIVWKKKGQMDNLIPLLEEAIAYPDCPTLVKSCLANIYKARGKYARALEIWVGVAEQKNLDETYRHQSAEQIEDLRKKLKI